MNRESQLDAKFEVRLRRIIAEFGSRNGLSKASGIPASTLQGYEAGAMPGMDALMRLARVGNIDLNWLITGKGEIRPPGLISGAALSDIVMVCQYELGTALSMSMIIGHIPFSRWLLERKLDLKDPTYDTLLVAQAGWDLYQISRGDLVLIDRNQRNLNRDGIYLFDLPGIALRAVFATAEGKLRVEGPEQALTSREKIQKPRKRFSVAQERTRETLSADTRSAMSKVVGRAVWIARGI